MRRRALLAALLAGGLASPGRSLAAKPLAPPMEKFVKTAPARPVEDLLMTGGDGAGIDLAAYRGRFIVLNLWGSWCFPCREEMPGLSRLAGLLAPSGVSVLPLAIERHGAEAVIRFYQETGINNLPVLLGRGENIAAVFAAWGLPFTVLIDARGREIGRVTGPAKWDDPAAVSWLSAAAAA